MIKKKVKRGGVGRREEKGERELSGKDGGKGLDLKGVCLIALPREREMEQLIGFLQFNCQSSCLSSEMQRESFFSLILFEPTHLPPNISVRTSHEFLN